MDFAGADVNILSAIALHRSLPLHQHYTADCITSSIAAAVSLLIIITLPVVITVTVTLTTILTQY